MFNTVTPIYNDLCHVSGDGSLSALSENNFYKGYSSSISTHEATS